MWHCGWPPRDVRDVLDRVRRGLPVYWPSQPADSQQDIYREFAKRRGPNSNA